MISVRRSLRLAALVVALSLVACGPGPQTPVGAGLLVSGPWDAVAYAGGGDLGVCLEIRAAGRDSDRLCGLRADNASTWQPDAPPDEEAFLVGATGIESASEARVTFADGTEISMNPAPAPDLTDLRFFVFALDPDADPVRVEVLDEVGLVLTTFSLE